MHEKIVLIDTIAEFPDYEVDNCGNVYSKKRKTNKGSDKEYVSPMLYMNKPEFLVKAKYMVSTLEELKKNKV